MRDPHDKLIARRLLWIQVLVLMTFLLVLIGLVALWAGVIPGGDFGVRRGGMPAPSPVANRSQQADTEPPTEPLSDWEGPSLPAGAPTQEEPWEVLGELATGPVEAATVPLLTEVDPFEQGGELFYERASYYLRQRDCIEGGVCFEAQIEDGTLAAGRVVFRPRLLRIGGLDQMSFAYRKTNPASRLWLGVIGADSGRAAVVREGSPSSRPGWVPHRLRADWQTAEVDLAALLREAGVATDGGRLEAVFFGLTNADAGDAVIVDGWRLRRGGARPPKPGGVVSLSGRLIGPSEDQVVRMRVGERVEERRPGADGSFRFTRIPRGAVAELYAFGAGRQSYSVAGDYVHMEHSRADAHIITHDLVARVAATVEKVDPTWSTMGGPGLPEFGTQFVPHKAMSYVGVMNRHYEFSVMFVPNRFGAYDRDHRFPNADDSFRILLLGDCTAEGLQSRLHERVGPRLETFLRRRHGRNVEVITLGFSNANPAAVWPLYQKLGKRFSPDLVLLDVNAAATVYMEPRIMKNILGWDPQRAAHTTMSLSEDGRLEIFPPEPGWAAHATKPEGRTLAGDVPPAWAMHLAEPDLPPEGVGLSRLLPAVLSLYASDVALEGTPVVGFTGSRAYAYGDPRELGGKPASQPLFVDNMGRWLRRAGLTHLDVSDHVLEMENAERVLRWRNDGHPTPLLHYLVAESLADQLVARGLVGPPSTRSGMAMGR